MYIIIFKETNTSKWTCIAWTYTIKNKSEADQFAKDLIEAGSYKAEVKFVEADYWDDGYVMHCENCSNSCYDIDEELIVDGTDAAQL
jgi:hypothetical protein